MSFTSLDGVVEVVWWGYGGMVVVVVEGVVAVTGGAGYAGWVTGVDDATRPEPGYCPTP